MYQDRIITLWDYYSIDSLSYRFINEVSIDLSMKEIYYPSIERICEYNMLSLAITKSKRADKSFLASKEKLFNVLDLCKKSEGDLYDKSIILLKGIIQKHPFVSGNRRTAFIIMKDFLLTNNIKIGVNGDPAFAKVLQGVRENYYSDEEIKEWIQRGKIKLFQR